MDLIEKPADVGWYVDKGSLVFVKAISLTKYFPVYMTNYIK